MKFDHYFFPLFKKSDGRDPLEILNKIRQHADKEFYVLADGYNLSWLRDCINEANCRVIFSATDQHVASSRMQFLQDTLPKDKRANIIFASHVFTTPELRAFLQLGASVILWKLERGPIKHPITSWSRKFPNQLRLACWGFWSHRVKLWIDLKLALTYYFRKGDFSFEDLESLASRGKDKAVIIADDFTDDELTQLTATGAKIWTNMTPITPDSDSDPDSDPDPDPDSPAAN